MIRTPDKSIKYQAAFVCISIKGNNDLNNEFCIICVCQI